MKTGILGSGMVGQAIAARLYELGHDVMIGTRNPEKLSSWLAEHHGVKVGSFAETASHGEMLFNAVSGTGTLDALQMAGESNLNEKIMVDISNPLDFSKGFPPSLSVSNTNSLGEQIQQAYPALKVVKSLNTITAQVMIHPRKLAEGDHQVFISGNDADAKSQVTKLLESFGWLHIMDLGDITTARGTEMYLPLWVRMYGTLQDGMFNIKIVK